MMIIMSRSRKAREASSFDLSFYEAIERRSALICRSKKSLIFRHFLDSI